MNDSRIDSVLGSWAAWAGDRSRWPVSSAGETTVEWAVNVHRAHFGDELLQRALGDSPPHPFVEHGRWPLTGHHAIVELLTRACALTMLSSEARAALTGAMASGDTNRKLSSELYVLEVAGLAARDAWAVEVEPALPSGRRPDLRLTRDDTELWIEVSSAGPDLGRRTVEAWSHAVVQALMVIGSRHCVDISGDAISTELEGRELEAFLEDVEVAAERTAATGEVADLTAPGISIAIHPEGGGLRSFDCPPLTGDMWTKLERRLLDKARQTKGAPAAWICLQDRSGLFQLTNLAAVDEHEQLRQLAHNVTLTLRDSPHVAGVLLSTGIKIDSGEVDHDTVLSDHEDWMIPGSTVLRRRLPGGRCRRTFVIRLSTDDGCAGAVPQTWFENEGTWLAWALREAGQPDIEFILKGTR